MKIIEGIEDISEEFNNLCVALGTFDGIHKGHKEVIKRAVQKAKETNGKSMVFTFSPHPLKVITSKKGPQLINSKHEKILLLKELNVDILLFANFTVEFSDMHPVEFFENILKDSLDVKHLFVGFNYTFGKYGAGDTKFLEELCSERGIQANIVPPISIDNEVVSSTAIRQLICNGNLEKAKKFLGYDYMITGKVEKGRKIATDLGFPTANLKIVHKVYPPYGVYGVKVVFKNNEYYGIMNIGRNPTLKPGEHSIEVHIFDFNEELYNRNIIIRVLKFIREERKFDSIEELKSQIKEDIKKWKGMKNNASSRKFSS